MYTCENYFFCILYKWIYYIINEQMYGQQIILKLKSSYKAYAEN